MKKIFLILIILALFFYKDSDAETVFNDDFEYSFYILEFPNNDLSTNNFNSIISDVQIIWIRPYVNNLYLNKLNRRYFYDNVDKFKDKFIEEIASLYYEESLKLKIDGIIIKQVKVYSDGDSINKIKNKIEVNIEKA